MNRESALRVWTINVSGQERHDGQKPYTYVLHADSMEDAKRQGWLYHVWTEISEEGSVAADGTVPSWSEEKNTMFAFGEPIDDVVVIDCPEFPCAEGQPFECRAPIHFGEGPRKWARKCRCEWHWNSISVIQQRYVDQARLLNLGYRLPDIAPEENEW